MAETYIQANADGSGKKIRTYSRTISSQDVHEEVQQAGQPYLPTYSVTASSVSIATAASHVLQIMAGSSLHVRILRIRIHQQLNVTTAAQQEWNFYRLTTAGTGGTTVTPRALDSGDSAAGATAMTLPSSKGTEGNLLGGGMQPLIQTSPTGGLSFSPSLEWSPAPYSKPYIIPAGTSNGLALKNVGANAAGTVFVVVEFTETAWL